MLPSQPWCMKFSQHRFNLFNSLLVLFSIFMVCKSKFYANPHSPSLNFSEHQPTDDVGNSPIKNTPIKRIPIPELGIFATPVAEVYQTPTVPPYCQTPAPLTISQNYVHRLVADHWDAEIKQCEQVFLACIRESKGSGGQVRRNERVVTENRTCEYYVVVRSKKCGKHEDMNRRIDLILSDKG
ncbi:hypothetical protein BDR03DRAFT_985447 [Suillus americanus]|nr:hypothetical protein BDR03DRAFT_985447 [Suillus americanus]